MIRIVVADDHPIVRDGLAAVLATQRDFAVVAQAADGEEALQAVQSARPDLLLLDLEMPRMDGVEVLRVLQEQRLGARVIVFTAYDSDRRVMEALEAGAQGYLLKGAPREELFQAIRVAARGGSPLEPAVAARLLQRVRRPTERDALALSPREREVLALIAEGRLNKEIAAALGIRERTVKFHVSSLLAKLGAGNRTEAVRIALEEGLIPPPAGAR